MARLTKKERSFCIGFINSGDIDFAERYSGLDNGRELLCREEIRDELRRLSDVFNESVAYTASAGLKKLAMGSVADAVSLLYKEKPDHDVLEKMDLFLVSEIKRKDIAHVRTNQQVGLVFVKFAPRHFAVEYG